MGTRRKRQEGIIRGQPVRRQKVALARQLRTEMTPQETRLWVRLRRNSLDGLHFRRQQVVDGFIVDFYCHAARLVIETDGPVHQEQADYDEERSKWLQARGLRVIRITNAEVDGDVEAVLSHIAAACREQLDKGER
jgi:very-short-patch-repair endonuclease